MKDGERTITRRDFLRGATYATVAFAMGLLPEEEKTVELPAKTRVVLIRDPDAFDDKGRFNAKVIQRMLDDAVATLFDKKDPVEAWKLLVKPTDVVGVKSNVWGPLPTPREVEGAITKRVMDAGVSEKNIDVDDRGVLRNRIFAKATALINTRPLRTHAWSGVGGCIKNYIMFSPSPPKYHPDSCADLGALWSLPMVKGKTRLNILVMLGPQFHNVGRHHFDPKYIWPYKGLLVGTDPVALDAVGLRIFGAKRLAYFEEERALKPPAHHIVLADTRHKVGTSDLRRIELVKLGWQEGILI
jgi:hypothetical protein